MTRLFFICIILQEISQRLLEAISTIAGSSLEQTTWLRKNYAVKPGPQSEEAEHDDSHQDEGKELFKRVKNTSISEYLIYLLLEYRELLLSAKKKNCNIHFVPKTVLAGNLCCLV